MKKVLILSLTLFLMGGVCSCKKLKTEDEKEKKEQILFTNDWVNQTPERVHVDGYLYDTGVVELSFREDSKGCGWGPDGSGKTIENKYFNNGDTTFNETINWGFWRYKAGEFVTGDTSKIHNFPSELNGTKPIVELWSDSEGLQRFFVLNIEEGEIKVIFMYISGVGNQVEYYYSPIWNFQKK